VPTNRRPPKRHRLNAAITTEAVNLYRRGKALQAKGFGESKEFCEIAHKLDLELKLKPWVDSPLHPLGDRPPADVPKALHHYWHTVHAIQQQLDRAVARITTPLPPSERVVPLNRSRPHEHDAATHERAD
jgi:hypothetical protein